MTVIVEPEKTAFKSKTRIDTHSGEATVKIVLLPSEKGSTLKGKNLLPLGVNSFLFRVDPLSEGDWCAKTQKKKQKLSPL